MEPIVANKKTATPAPPDFEAALRELEGIVEKIERGEQSLEEALRSFERGVELTRICQEGLKAAEQRLDQLTRQGDGFRVEPLAIEPASEPASD